MKRRKFLPLMSMVLLLAMGLPMGCDLSTPTPEPDQVILQLNWYHEAEFTGYYVAEAKGFYDEENITVVIYEGGIGLDAAQLLADRAVDFSVLGFGEHRAMLDADEQAIAVMAIYQVSPLVLFALSSSSIRSPKDMAGRRVAIKAEPWRDVIHRTLAKVGVTPEEIVEVEVEYDAIEMLYDGEVDVWTGFVHDEPTEARLAGYEVNLIFPADYGVGAYEGLLVVRQDTFDQTPELVSRFVHASLQGWQYAIEHPNEAAEIIARWQPDKGLNFYRLAIQSLVPLIDTGHVPIGWIDDETWQISMGTSYDPDRPGYTMQFVQAAPE